MFKSSLIIVPITVLVILVTGLMSELCCCSSPVAAVFLGLAAGVLCGVFEKPAQKSRALRRGAIAGAVAGTAALPAQVLGEIVVALALAGSGKVDISLFGVPAASATVDLWNWALNALFAATLYGLISAAIMAGTGAVGSGVWFRIHGKGKPESRSAVEPPRPEPSAESLKPPANPIGKTLLSGIIMAAVSFVFFLLIRTTWGCLALPAALILGFLTGVLSGNLAKPSAPVRAVVFGGIAGLIAAIGSIFGDIAGLLIRVFLVQTPQGINSMTSGFYEVLGMGGEYSTRTPMEILMDDVSVLCCCSVIFLAVFVGLGGLGGFLWFQRRSKIPAGTGTPPAEAPR
jgi:hypothetical protein